MPFDVSDVLPKLKQFNTVHYIAHRKLNFKYCTRPGAVTLMSYSARLPELGVDSSLARRGSKS
jgi:hypothetical protein